MTTKVDNILESICDFGRYQKLVLFLLTIPACFQNAFNLFVLVFLFYTPDHRCRHTPTTTTNVTVLLGNTTSESLNHAVEDSVWIADECTLFTNSNSASSSSSSMSCPYGWSYDDTYFSSTLIIQWDLVCDRSILAKNMLFVLSLSAAVGCFVISWIQDKYGRKPAFVVTLSLYIFPSLASIYAPGPLEFTVIRAISSLPTISSWNVAYCWAVEYVGQKRRTLVTTLLCVFYALGVISLGVIAHFCKTWTHLVWATTLPFVAAYALVWIIDESPQWLYAEGRKKEAALVFQKIAKWEGVEIPESKLKSLLSSDDEEGCDENSNASASDAAGLVSLFRSENLRAKCILLTIVMIACNIVYNTIGYNVENLGGHLILVFVLQASVEAPATLLNLLVLDKYGRVWPLTFGTFLSATFILLTVAGDLYSPWLTAAFAILGKFFICCSYANIFQLSGELFPTVLRGEGVGFSCIVAEVVNTVMPYILHSSELYKMLPMVILGAFCLVGSLASSFLPETLNKSMPLTVAQAEAAVTPAGKQALRENIERLLGPSRRLKGRRKEASIAPRHPLLVMSA